MDGTPPRPGFRTGVSVQTQSVLYNTPLSAVTRSLEYYNSAARRAQEAGAVQNVVIAYGDCSSAQTLDVETVWNLRHRFTYLADIKYTYFGDNLGSAAGHNRLLDNAATHFVMTANPDILVSPTLYIELLSALGRRGVGLAEGRQLPIEHAKFYDPTTGETSWGSTACLIGPTRLFHQARGFDADTFFLYCDDVDFSWRVRLLGFKVIHQPAAVVYHDKRLSKDGGWLPSASERYYSSEAALLLPYKYSREDLTEAYFEAFRQSGDEYLTKAAAAFELRVKTGRLPDQIDADHSVGQFIDDGYAPWRYKPR